MSQSVWPFDHCLAPRFASRARFSATDLDKLRCFVICPAQPAEYFDDLYSLVELICQRVAETAGIEIQCTRAIDIRSSGVIHPEIWGSLRAADVIVADVSGLNGNVLFELGVASAWHPKERVIVLRERRSVGIKGDETDIWLFDMQPFRHLLYIRTLEGLVQLTSDLKSVLVDVLAAAPFEDAVDIAEPTLPLSLPLSDQDAELLFSPALGHRRWISGECLEFGSLNNFQYSWLTVGNLKLKNVQVSAELSFRTLGKPRQDQPWIGLMLRSQSFWANQGHLAYIRADGSVWITVEKPEHADEPIGQIELGALNGYIPFRVTINDSGWAVCVGSVEYQRSLEGIQVFGQGRILFESYWARVGLRNLTIQLA
jgi:hypothetical protein